MAYQSSFEDIEDEISSWGYTTSPADFARTLDAERHIPQSRIGGRGRGITNPQHMANVRLAASINDLKVHPFPMGHMPTTNELLAAPPDNEITPMLRQLGLNSRGEDLQTRTTRMQPTVREEIRVDGSLPVILNGDLFRNACDDDDEGIVEVESFDPKRPLPEQFSTIPELIPEPEIVPETSKPKNQSQSRKGNITDSSIDSAISSGSSSQSKKGKKKKWRKLTGQELMPTEPERGRYEEVYSIGVHDARVRQIYNADGLVGWANH